VRVNAAIHRVDVVGKGKDRLGVGVVVLQRNLHGHVVTLGLHVDRLFVQDLLALVQVLDELGDASDILELLVLALTGLRIGRALVGQVNLQALVQEGQLTQPLGQGVVVVLRDREDRLVRKEVDLRSQALRRSHLTQLADRVTLRVVLRPGKAVAPYLDVELLAQRVDAAHADAMQTARHLVVRGIELAARMQHRQHDLHPRHRLAVHRLVVDRDTAPVVGHGDGVVHVDRHIDPGRMPCQRLIDGIIDHLVDQMMQTLLARRADVHRRPLTDRCQTFENRNVLRRVAS
jgi:hypothetical protein